MLCTVVWTSCNQIDIQQTYTADLETKIKLNAPYGTMAGSSMEVFLYSPSSGNIPISLLIDNGLTIQRLHCRSNEKINIDGSYFRRAGIYNISAIHNNQIIAKRKLKIKPSTISEHTKILTGPSSILVNGLQQSMVTLIPQDIYANPITDNHLASFRTNLENEPEASSPLRHLLTHYIFSSQSKAGKVLIGASLDGNANTEQAISQTPAWPQAFKIEVVTQHPYADGRQYTRLRTNFITDQYGNTISDGTLVTFELATQGKLTSSYKSIVIGGVANVYVKNPDRPMVVSVHAHIGPSKSQKLSLNYQENIQELIFNYDKSTRKLRVGPLHSALQQYVPDGTAVSLKYKRKRKTKETINGVVEFDLSGIKNHKELKFLLEVGGHTKKLNL